MSNTHVSLARYLSMQAVYQLKINNLSFENTLKQYNDWHIKNIFFDFENSFKKLKFKLNKEYFNLILDKYNKEEKFITSIIDENLNEKWKSERLPIVLHSIIKVAVSEMIINPKLSIGIIASEYIILTNCFFTEKESSFVNALLETIFKKLNSK